MVEIPHSYDGRKSIHRTASVDFPTKRYLFFRPPQEGMNDGLIKLPTPLPYPTVIWTRNFRLGTEGLCRSAAEPPGRVSREPRLQGLNVQFLVTTLRPSVTWIQSWSACRNRNGRVPPDDPQKSREWLPRSRWRRFSRCHFHFERYDIDVDDTPINIFLRWDIVSYNAILLSTVRYRTI